MKLKAQIFNLKKNESGFTLIEIMVASSISILLLAILAGVVTRQGDTFVLQNQLNKMQTNGRAATEFLSRAVQNAGYNVFRGTRFLAASDHYISAVFDADNDGIIQNNEVMTFATGNDFTASDETFNINPYFDRDGDGVVDGTETATFPIAMTLTGPPYNIYKVLPANSGTGVTRHLMARNIDNLVIRYYDKDDSPLPAGVAVDGNGLPIPPYDFSADISELNDIRKVDIEVVARTQNPNPRNENLPQGTYVAGSVATLAGSNTYDDPFYRETFTANQAPRNLVMAPWGKMNIVANPLSVNCPVASTSVTATLVDAVGDPVSSGISINFAASGGASVSPLIGTTNSFGEATSTVSYDWSAPNASITVSANSMISANGKQYPVFSASTANFQSGTGTFADTFTGGLDPNWVEIDNPGDMIEWDSDADTVDDSLRMLPTGFITRAVNGCSWQKYQVEFELTASGDLNNDRFVGGFLRYDNANNNYSFQVYRQSTGNCVGADGKDYCLKIVHWNGFFANDIGSPIGIDLVPGVKYKMLAQVEDDDLRAKIWDADALGLADPNPNIWVYDLANFSTVYPIEVQDTTIASGQIGLLGDWTNGVNVVFDNFAVSPIS